VESELDFFSASGPPQQLIESPEPKEKNHAKTADCRYSHSIVWRHGNGRKTFSGCDEEPSP
jgi:hypothetical protein